MVTIILGILAAVAIPRYSNILSRAEESAEKTFVNNLWASLEDEAKDRLMETGIESWPDNPLSVVGRTRNTIIDTTDGLPDEDNEWRFSTTTLSNPALFHQRRNDEVYYYTYKSNDFYLAEEPTLYSTE